MSVSETAQTGISENSLGAASYLTIVPAIVFLAIAPYNRSANVRFHAWLSIMLGATAFLLNLAVNLVVTFLAQITPFFSMFTYLSLSMIIGVTYIMVSAFCAIRALNGKHTKLPPFTAWAERQANR
jgi:uncharacterized membrane protein